MKKLPNWSTPEADAEELGRLQAMTPQERWLEMCEIQRLMEKVLLANPDRERVLAMRDEPSPESLALWHRLMDRHRRGRPL